MRSRAALVALLVVGTVVPGAAHAAAPTTEQLVHRALESAPARTPQAGAPFARRVDPASETATLELGAGAEVSVTPVDPARSVSRLQPDGVQVLTVLHRGRTARFTVDLADGMRLVDTGAGYDVVADGPAGSVRLAEVEAPWAVDARGRRLATRYALRGDTLVQTVDVDGAAYPIVVDPSVAAKWYGYQVRFSLRETKAMAASSGAVAYIASQIPAGPVAKVIAGAAGAMSVWSATALLYGKCVAVSVRLVWPKGFWPWYWSC